MTSYLTGSDLASFLGRDRSATLDNIVDRTNGLIDEAWANPVAPVLQWVSNIAWDVAVRAGANTVPGLTSTTKSWDDVTRTDRFEADQKFGVYLTDDERELLAGTSASSPTTVPAKSIRMTIPGWSRPPGWPRC